jgi:hypothetical protein
MRASAVVNHQSTVVSAALRRAPPGGHLARHRCVVAESLIQTLAQKGAQFDLLYVQPTAVLRRVMDLQFVGQALGLRWRERLVERGRRVDVELVRHQHDALGSRVVDIGEFLDTSRPIEPGPLIANADLAPAPQRLADQ